MSLSMFGWLILLIWGSPAKAQKGNCFIIWCFVWPSFRYPEANIFKWWWTLNLSRIYWGSDKTSTIHSICCVHWLVCQERMYSCYGLCVYNMLKIVAVLSARKLESFIDDMRSAWCTYLWWNFFSLFDLLDADMVLIQN